MLWVALLILLYGYLEAQFIRVRRDRLALGGLPRAFDGFRVVHLSDLHSWRFGRREKRLCRLLRGMEADLTVFTGDYKRRKATKESKVGKVLQEVVPCVRSRFGILGVLGNKDNPLMIEQLQRAGIESLSGRAKHLSIGKDLLWVAGIDAPILRRATKALITVTAQIPDGSFKILLSHGPDIARLASALGYALTLCGDTHGGQLRLPLIGAPVVKTEVSRRYCRGIIHERNSVLCVNTGIGTCAFPIRLLCPPEIRILTLVSKTSPPHSANARKKPHSMNTMAD